MKRFIYIVSLLTLTICSSFSHAYSYRHIYNPSSQPWTVEFIRFSGDAVTYSYDCVYNRPCVIKPGDTVEIRYGRMYSSGTVRITDVTGRSKDFYYYTKAVYGYIEHDGATGNVSLNDPAKGDIRISRNAEHW